MQITECKLSQSTRATKPAIFHRAIVCAALQQDELESVRDGDSEYLAEKRVFIRATYSLPARSALLLQQGSRAIIGVRVYRDIRDAAEMSLQSATFVWSEAV